MKPYISEILELNGKTYRLPVNPKYRELLDCVHSLGIKESEDENGKQLLGYESLYDPKPEADEYWKLVQDTDASLSMLTPRQAEMVMGLCAAFGLKFNGVLRLIDAINKIKNEDIEHYDSFAVYQN